MTVLPIVDRELRGASRRPATYWIRTAMAFLALAVAGIIILFSALSRSTAPQTVGMTVFWWLSWLSFIFCLNSGAMLTGDCLSFEKREGTLGLLFLTDLKGYDVVLGKLTASSISGLLSILAVMPVMCLPLLMGGISGSAMLHVAVVLLNTLFFSLAAGALASTLARDERKSIGGAVVLILGFSILLPACGGALEAGAWGRWRHEVAEGLCWPSPGYSMVIVTTSALGNTVPSMTFRFWGSILLVHGIAWICLLASCWFLPRTWKHSETASKAGFFRRWMHWFRFGGSGLKSRMRRWLDVNPVTWLVCRDRSGQRTIWAVLTCIGIAWACGWWYLGRDWLEYPVAIMTGLILGTTLKYSMATEACRRFSEDRHNGALELILSTPIRIRDILNGQNLGFWHMFLWPLIVVLILDALLFWGGSSFHYSNHSEMLAMFMAGMVVLVADLFTLPWLGMWCSLRARNYTVAFSQTFFLVTLLPWTLFVLSMVAGALLDEAGIRLNPESYHVLGYWVFLSLATDALLFLRSSRNLRQRLRDEVAARYSGKPRGMWPFRRKQA